MISAVYGHYINNSTTKTTTQHSTLTWKRLRPNQAMARPATSARAAETGVWVAESMAGKEDGHAA